MERNAKGQFLAGKPPENRYAVGTVRIRTRRRGNGEQRAYIKVAEPNTWRLRAHVVWEQHAGPIPKGYEVHHRDENKLHDDLANLALVTRSEHLVLHRPAFNDKRAKASAEARRRLRWSSKSATKHTGHPRSWTDEQLDAALTAFRAEKGATQASIERRFGLPLGTIGKQKNR
jgi:hypothetical protein